MVEALLIKLVPWLVLMLIVSGVGIAVLIGELIKERREATPVVVAPPRERPAPAAQPQRAPSQYAARATNVMEQGTVMVTRNTMDASAAAAMRETRIVEEDEGTLDAPTIPMMSTRRDRRLQATGSNIVLNLPVNPEAYDTVPGKLEVIYGNFSPTDPREILFFVPKDHDGPRHWTFSKTAGEGVFHVQLNHYTVTPQVQADLAYEEGGHILTNTVPDEEMERYQTRINGIPMDVGARHALASGDIISMGIYRLKLTL
jgi:hypothetical protein